MTEANKNCSICLDDLTKGSVFKLKECGHEFHTECIINWFRSSSSCPTCRGEQSQEYQKIGFTIKERLPIIKKIAKRKNAPKDLKKLIENLNKASKKNKLLKKELIKYKLENKNIIKEGRLIRNNLYNTNTEIGKIERLISLYNCKDYPMPNLILKNCNGFNHF